MKTDIVDDEYAYRGRLWLSGFGIVPTRVAAIAAEVSQRISAKIAAMLIGQNHRDWECEFEPQIRQLKAAL